MCADIPLCNTYNSVYSISAHSSRKLQATPLRDVTMAGSPIRRCCTSFSAISQNRIVSIHCIVGSGVVREAVGACTKSPGFTYDQPDVAARIAHKQTGVVTLLDKLTADHLAFLLNEVLTDTFYQENPHIWQKAIAYAKAKSGVRAALAFLSYSAPNAILPRRYSGPDGFAPA